MMKTNEENGMMQIMADARREALQASMLTARIIDLPAFVKAIGIIRTEDAKLTNSFVSAILAYVNTPSSETLNRAWNKLCGVNAIYRSRTESFDNGNEGDSIFMQYVKTESERLDAVEDILHYMNQCDIRTKLYCNIYYAQEHADELADMRRNR